MRYPALSGPILIPLVTGSTLTARDLEDPDLVVGRLSKLFFLLVEKSEKASELEKENEELKRKLREVEEELESWRRMESILRPDYEAH